MNFAPAWLILRANDLVALWLGRGSSESFFGNTLFIRKPHMLVNRDSSMTPYDTIDSIVVRRTTQHVPWPARGVGLGHAFTIDYNNAYTPRKRVWMMASDRRLTGKSQLYVCTLEQLVQYPVRER